MVSFADGNLFIQEMFHGVLDTNNRSNKTNYQKIGNF